MKYFAQICETAASFRINNSMQMKNACHLPLIKKSEIAFASVISGDDDETIVQRQRRHFRPLKKFAARSRLTKPHGLDVVLCTLSTNKKFATKNLRNCFN